MATEKISTTVDGELLVQVRKRVGRRGLSAFINEAVAEKLQRERVIVLVDALEAVQPPTRAERAAAEKELARLFDGGA
jgi:hypothetical protein